MNTTFVLIMLFGGASSQSGLASIQQEFTSREKCEAARIEIAKAHQNNGPVKLQVQGCFSK